jgi:hypothetical protein
MNKRQKRIRYEERKLKRLIERNKKLKARNKKLKATNISLKKKNSILRRNIRIKSSRLKRIKTDIKPKDQEISSYYRYSIGYYNAIYDKTFRAEVYTTTEQSTTDVQRQLSVFLLNRIASMNKGVQALFRMSTFVGLESEEVGINDIGKSELNKMHFWID